MTTAQYEVVAPQAEFEKWLGAHSTGIGASEIATLFGVGHRSKLRLWAEKTGRLPNQELTQEYVRWGNLLEPVVAAEYERQTGRKLTLHQRLLRSTEHSWAIATPDYELPGGIPVEIKTTNHFRAGDWGDSPPLSVVYQLHQQMLVTGASWGSTGVLIGGQTFRWCDVDRDEPIIDSIIALGAEFWRLVTDDIMPIAEGDDLDALGELFPKPTVAEVTLPAEAVHWAEQLEAARQESSAASSLIDDAKAKLIAAIGPAGIGILPDGSGSYSLKLQERKGYTVAPSSTRILRRMK